MGSASPRIKHLSRPTSPARERSSELSNEHPAREPQGDTPRVYERLECVNKRASCSRAQRIANAVLPEYVLQHPAAQSL